MKESYEQGIEFSLQVDRYSVTCESTAARLLRYHSSSVNAPSLRIRLRKKTWRSAGTVYLDDQVFEKDIHIFANFEMYVEPLKGQSISFLPSYSRTNC